MDALPATVTRTSTETVEVKEIINAEIYNVNCSFTRSLGGYFPVVKKTYSFLFRIIIAQLCTARLSIQCGPASQHMISPSASTGLGDPSTLQPNSAASTIVLLGSQASARQVRVGDRRTNKRTDKQNDPRITAKWFNRCIYCVGTTCVRWIFFANTYVSTTTQQNTATTIEACRAACVGNTQCNGIDWVAAATIGTKCKLSVATSAVKKIGGATGSGHYDFSKNCKDQGNNHGRNLVC